ncbi:MAG: Rdx family protein [Phycisphaerae bacterium]
MAGAIKKQFGVDAKIIKGAGGVFDVRVDGESIWSKHHTGRFPEHHEVLERIKTVTAKG